MSFIFEFFGFFISLLSIFFIGFLVVLCVSWSGFFVKKEKNKEDKKIDELLKTKRVSKEEAVELKKAVNKYKDKDDDKLVRNIRVHLATVGYLQIVAILIPYFFLMIYLFPIDDAGKILSVIILLYIFVIQIISVFYMMKRKIWAKIIIALYSIVFLFYFPVCTILGVYSLYVLLFVCAGEKYNIK